MLRSTERNKWKTYNREVKIKEKQKKPGKKRNK